MDDYDVHLEAPSKSTLYSALFKITFKMNLTIVPPLGKGQALTPNILRSKIAALVKKNCGVFNGITYVARNRLEDHCEDIEYGRSYGTPCEIAAFCDMFLCEILLFRSSRCQLLFPSKFETCKVRGTLYFRRRFFTEQPSASIQAFLGGSGGGGMAGSECTEWMSVSAHITRRRS